MLITSSQDTWALGVIAYEAVVGATTFTDLGTIGECAAGFLPYPWERPLEAQPLVWRRSKLRARVTPLLARDPSARQSMAGLLDALGHMGHATTMY